MLTQTLPDLDSWVHFFCNAELPVLRQTVRKLEEVRENRERINSRALARIVLQDPLMTAKVLAYTQIFAKTPLHNDITNIANAIVMLGVEPFFEKFKGLKTIEELLAKQPTALLGTLHMIRRVQRAAHYAHDWSLWRQDMNVEEVTAATLLHDIAEILLWCFAPALAGQINSMQKTDRTLRSTAAQQMVLGIQLLDLQLALCRAWHLPDLLAELMDTGLHDSDHTKHPRIRTVHLAVDLARHSANGWDNAALPHDFAAIGNLLNLNRDALIARLHLTDEEKAQLPPMAKTPPSVAPGRHSIW